MVGLLRNYWQVSTGIGGRLIPEPAAGLGRNMHFPCIDKNEFDSLWDGKYNYKNLRKARNQIAHNSYEFNGDLIVKDENGNILINWNFIEIEDFVKIVNAKAKAIIK